MTALIMVLGSVALLAAAGVAIVWVRTRDRVARANRLELERHQAFVAGLHTIAIRQLGVDPSAQVFEMEIRNFRERTCLPSNL
ncbi:hypothetical protein [Nonomuraea dietziae]|uniref:hypothetical protein n=1 Tax=Nonomuraea dietziae TaxID=65515 RepID=UPI00341FB94F